VGGSKLDSRIVSLQKK